MDLTNDWLSYSMFCPRREWRMLLGSLETFLSSGFNRELTLMRIVEFNYLYGSNIRLSVLPSVGNSLSLTTQLQIFFKDRSGVQVIPGRHAKTQTNGTTIAIRLLLSDVIMEAFSIEEINDETLFNKALYLHLALLKNSITAIAPLLSYAGRAVITEDPFTTMAGFKAEYVSNIKLVKQMRTAVFCNNRNELPVWLPAWIEGYETITDSLQKYDFPAIYRLTMYLIIKQLGLAGSLIQKLEYYIKKIAAIDVIHL
jgi:hypothetical protein